MRRALLASSLGLLGFAACSGGGGGNQQPVATATTGSVYVVIDTATGNDGVVQFVVGGAVLERSDGTLTGNLLTAAQSVTFADPAGEVVGLPLRAVPTGAYSRLHLMLLPGSGIVQWADGVVLPLTGPLDLDVPIADGLQHDVAADSWLAIGHNTGNTVVAAGTGFVWQPAMAGRLDGSSHWFEGLQPLSTRGGEVLAVWPAAANAVVHVDFAPSCSYTDSGDPTVVSRAEFLGRLGDDDELRIEGELQRDGRVIAAHARAERRNDSPRLIGRITELRPAEQSFVMHVQAQTRRGERLPIAAFDALVHTAGAAIHRPEAQFGLQFDDLAIGQLAKVRVAVRGTEPGGGVVIDALDIEITGAHCMPLRPEWQGRVTAIDTVLGSITVEPRDVPIVIQGVEVASATVLVDQDTVLWRRDAQGPGRHLIELSEVAPGQDRIWWRGVVQGPATVLGTWVRVRQE